MTSSDETVTVNPSARQIHPGARWQPVIGAEATALIDRKLRGPDGQAVLNAAVEILSHSVPKGKQGQETGLVVGYVQSGKTLSFTTTIALAHDNGFQIVVVIAGTSVPLFKQSTTRLRSDLRIDDVEGAIRWKHYENPGDDATTVRHIQQALDDWRDPTVAQSDKATILVTVMKHHRHLARLARLLNKLPLDDVPTLVIDDEADQASLNTLVKKGRQSTTYERLLALRNALKTLTYLQYTATPQAPLLINIIDSLSPSFVHVLEPGANYVGGREFFIEETGLISEIPPDDIPSPTNPLSEPPNSLLKALGVFLIGVAAGIAARISPTNANRSMLVHPSQRTSPHQDYKRWLETVFDSWRTTLTLSRVDPDYIDLIDFFHEAYAELSKTADLPDFENIENHLQRAFRKTRIEEVNARGGKTPQIGWRQEYGWILVGGQAMDRGFTIEGLTVTYMPRGPGVGNADTIQQRGRFFGYKRPYLGFCRIYLERDARESFSAYIEHEEFMRNQLIKVQRSGGALSEWKRAFVLSPDLKPCRHTVLVNEYARGNYRNEWFKPHVVLGPEEVINTNKKMVASFLGSLAFVTDTDKMASTEAQQHLVSRRVPLKRVLQEFVLQFRFTDADDSRHSTGLLLQLAEAIEANGDETCTIYHMSPKFQRTRPVNNDGTFKSSQLFQGPTKTVGGSYTYPGDDAIRDNDHVTIQIHMLDLKQNNQTVASGVPVIAVWIPTRLGLNWVAQHQPNQES